MWICTDIASGAASNLCAVDSVVTSGVRADRIAAVITESGMVWSRYEDFKHRFEDWAKQCRATGFQFEPLTVEAHDGGLGPDVCVTFVGRAGQGGRRYPGGAVAHAH